MRELESLPGKIEDLEQEQAHIVMRLNQPTIYRDHPDDVKTLQARFAEIEKDLTDCLTRWEELEAKSVIKS